MSILLAADRAVIVERDIMRHREGIILKVNFLDRLKAALQDQLSVDAFGELDGLCAKNNGGKGRGRDLTR
jgi:hypothetical protein